MHFIGVKGSYISTFVCSLSYFFVGENQEKVRLLDNFYSDKFTRVLSNIYQGLKSMFFFISGGEFWKSLTNIAAIFFSLIFIATIGTSNELKLSEDKNGENGKIY
jgi:hypothetical protein